MSYEPGELRQFKETMSLRHVVYEDGYLKQQRRNVRKGECFVILGEQVVEGSDTCVKVLLNDGPGFLYTIGLYAETLRIA